MNHNMATDRSDNKLITFEAFQKHVRNSAFVRTHLEGAIPERPRWPARRHPHAWLTEPGPARESDDNDAA